MHSKVQTYYIINKPRLAALVQNNCITILLKIFSGFLRFIIIFVEKYQTIWLVHLS